MKKLNDSNSLIELNTERIQQSFAEKRSYETES